MFCVVRRGLRRTMSCCFLCFHVVFFLMWTDVDPCRVLFVTWDIVFFHVLFFLDADCGRSMWSFRVAFDDWGSYKDNKGLSNFDATITNYEEWATDIKEHLSKASKGWSILLNFVEKQPHHHNYQMLSHMHVGGMNGWDIACTLGTFLVAWLGKAVKNRRLQLSGHGKRQWHRDEEAGVPRVRGHQRTH